MLVLDRLIKKKIYRILFQTSIMLILVFQLPFEISDPNLVGFTSSVQTGKHIDPGFGNKILSCQTLNQLKLTWESKKKVATEVSRNSD